MWCANISEFFHIDLPAIAELPDNCDAARESLSVTLSMNQCPLSGSRFLLTSSISKFVSSPLWNSVESREGSGSRERVSGLSTSDGAQNREICNLCNLIYCNISTCNFWILCGLIWSNVFEKYDLKSDRTSNSTYHSIVLTAISGTSQSIHHNKPISSNIFIFRSFLTTRTIIINLVKCWECAVL